MASYGAVFGAVEGMLLVLIAKEEDETSKGILWVLHGGDDSLSARRAPDFLEVRSKEKILAPKVILSWFEVRTHDLDQ